jgi:hypothetical protein
MPCGITARLSLHGATHDRTGDRVAPDLAPLRLPHRRLARPTPTGGARCLAGGAVMIGRDDLIWRGTDLLHNGKPVASIVPDAVHAGMWRVRLPDAPLSDMANRTRAKDAAACLVAAGLNSRKPVPGPAVVRFPAGAGTPAPGAQIVCNEAVAWPT